jgi:hypothetical protein
MYQTTLHKLLDSFRTAAVTEREKGTYFEELICTYLRNEATTVMGLTVAIIAAAQLVWQPGVKGVEAKSSHDRWHSLFNRFGKLSNAEIDGDISNIR